MKRRLENTQVPKPLPYVVSKALTTKGMLLNLKTGTYFQVNRTGLYIWQCCDGRSDLSAIVAKTARRFKKPVERVEGHVDEFVRLLKQRKLLELRRGKAK